MTLSFKRSQRSISKVIKFHLIETHYFLGIIVVLTVLGGGIGGGSGGCGSVTAVCVVLVYCCSGRRFYHHRTRIYLRILIIVQFQNVH